jgi:hypothetical protein
MFRKLQQLFRFAFALLMIPVLFAGCDMFFGDDREDSETSAAAASGRSGKAESNESEARGEEVSDTEDADAEVIAILERICESWKTRPTSPSKGESPSKQL